MSETQRVVWSNVAIAGTLLATLGIIYALGYSRATLSDEIEAVALVIMSLATFEFGRYVDRYNRTQASLRAKPRVLSIDQSRNLVALISLAVSCSVDAARFDWDEVGKVVGVAALLGLVEMVKAMRDHFGEIANRAKDVAAESAREMLRRVGEKLREKLVDFVVGAIIALTFGWVANVLPIGASKAVAAPSQPEATVSLIE